MTELEDDLDKLKRAVETLGESFDTVQIFTTRHESGEHDGTVRWTCSSGNFYARLGHVREWLVMQDENARIKARSDAGV